MGGAGIAVRMRIIINPAYKLAKSAAKFQVYIAIVSSNTIVIMKRALSLGEASAPEAKKRKVAYATFKKWKAEMDKECQTVTEL